MNIITRRPESEFDVYGDFEYGRFGDLRFRGAINIPLVDDKLFIRLAILQRSSDGNFKITNPLNRQKLNDVGLGSYRLSLRWLPHEDVSVDIIGGYTSSKQNGAGLKFEGDFSNGAYWLFPPGNPAGTVPTAGAGGGNGLDYTGALPNPASPYEGTANEPQFNNSTVWTVTAIVDWQVIEDAKLTSITGYQNTNFFLHRDQDLSSLPIQTLDLTDESREVFKELLLAATGVKAVE
jgi:iron complex outermembrane receptor protein